MRKLILIAAMSVLASQAYAGGSRSLSLAATNASQQATEQSAAAVSPQTSQAPSQPANAQTATTAPTSAPAATTSPAATGPAAQSPAAASTTGTTKPKRRQPSVETRVVRELHRHGIYW
ncbi:MULTISPECIES: hypothetical protein [Bradyrhizobium]|uniref:hypothetical protein n=1 Tax=Bradyrhizobium TaxID=374 RepID=UPI0003F94D9B|nr:MULTISPECIES: hypothetical protein [Bradyrhizobium]QOG16497.1 hypothetical protein FOM02_03265 [Bradyrhizobium sp. SEMIA]UFW49305.1 hypothetical protein BaraCB756_45045 [Bradyrhizobium arachidis]